jgi:hypothetical protein
METLRASGTSEEMNSWALVSCSQGGSAHYDKGGQRRGDFCLAYGLMALRCVLHVRSSAPVVVPSVSSASTALPAGRLLHIWVDWLVVGETDLSRECWCTPSVSAFGCFRLALLQVLVLRV